MRSSQTLNSRSAAKSRQLTSDTAADGHIQLIYAGGTFGCHGKPLSPIGAELFLPKLEQLLLSKQITNTAWLNNPLIKDSSQLTPTDFVHFYQLILSAYSQGLRRLVLITGTDTLSYLSAFLAEAFAGSDICIVVTGSMRPLFDADCIDDYIIDDHSDAWDNLTTAIGIAAFGEPGVRVCFAGESWPAQTVQKTHSHDLMAFTGHHRAAYPASSYSRRLTQTQRQHWLEDQQALQPLISAAGSQTNIHALYCLPNDTCVLESQLAALLREPASGILLIGFGAGNVPYSQSLAALLDQAYERGHMVVSSSQCPFGGVGSDYAAGSWQYQHHVISGGRLTLPAIYARLLWLHLRFDTPARRRQRWTYSVNQSETTRS